MRDAFHLLACITLLAVAPALTVAEDTKSNPVAASPGGKEFLVECKFITGISGWRAESGNSYSAPKLRVRDGQKAQIQESRQSACEIGETLENGVKASIARVISEGTTVEVTIRDIGRGKAILDATVELTSADGIDGDEPHPSVQVNTQKKRLIESITLGQKAIARFANSSVEIVVSGASE